MNSYRASVVVLACSLITFRAINANDQASATPQIGDSIQGTWRFDKAATKMLFRNVGQNGWRLSDKFTLNTFHGKKQEFRDECRTRLEGISATVLDVGHFEFGESNLLGYAIVQKDHRVFVGVRSADDKDGTGMNLIDMHVLSNGNPDDDVLILGNGIYRRDTGK